MTSEKQAAANRANSLKSTGPKTEAGKNRAKFNALRHGLTAQITVMTDAERVAFDAFTIQIVESFSPKTPYERQLAHALATCQWRINRAFAFKEGLLTLGIAEDNLLNVSIEHPEVHTALTQAAVFRASPQDFESLSLYTQRLVNQTDKLLKQLEHLQTARQTQEQATMRAASNLFCYHQLKDLPFDPRENGFVLTATEIQHQFHRDHLQRLADEAANQGSRREIFTKIYERKAA